MTEWTGHVQITDLEDSVLPLTRPVAALFFTMRKSKGRLFPGYCSFLGLMASLSVFGLPCANPLSVNKCHLEEQCRFKCLERSFSPSPVSKIVLYIYASSMFCCSSPLKADRNFAYIMLKLSYTSFKACKAELIYCGTAVLLLLPRPLTVLQKMWRSHGASPAGARSERQQAFLTEIFILPGFYGFFTS